MARVVFLVGLPGAGKSEASGTLIGSMLKDGFNIQFLTDKQALEQAVREDIQANGIPQANGSMRGEHSILYNPDGEDGTLQMEFIDGNALNTAHKRLMAQAAALADGGLGDNEVLIVEWAYGKDVPYPAEPLTQTGTQFISWLQEHGLHGHVPVVEVVADFNSRIHRNENRPGHIPTNEFKLYFPEEGHLTPDDRASLDGHYELLVNLGDKDALAGHVEEVYQRFIRPAILGEGAGRQIERPNTILHRPEQE